MIHVSQLGRLGGDDDSGGGSTDFYPTDFVSAPTSEGPTDSYTGDEFYTPAPLLDQPYSTDLATTGVALDPDYPVAYGPARSSDRSSGGSVSSGSSGSSWFNTLFGSNSPASAAYIPPPPPSSTGMPSSTIVLIGFGMVALLGVGYAVLSD